MTANFPAGTESSATTASSVPKTTRAVVQEFLVARMAGDTERLVALFADEVDWMLAENPASRGSARGPPPPNVLPNSRN